MTAARDAVDGNINGPLYWQEQARKILPVLVRQAKAQLPIQYENLGLEVGVWHRQLGKPLGCIGYALDALATEWDETVPHIQSLVIKKQTQLPSYGFDGFLESKGYGKLSQNAKRSLLNEYWAGIYAYPYWDEVLDALKLSPTATPLTPAIENAGRGGGGGEGPDHLALKNYVRDNPHLVGLNIGDPVGEVEYCLPSGDSVDVVFAQKRRIHAVEAKPAGSGVLDITRGLFQCVKYRAVIAARAAYEHDDREISACLALGGSFPVELIPLRNSLGVDVYESIVPT